MKIEICMHPHKCNVCGHYILKGEEMIHKKVPRNPPYRDINVNVCSVCIRRLSDSLDEDLLTQATAKRVLKEL